MRDLAAATPGSSTHVFYARPLESDRQGEDYDEQGLITADPAGRGHAIDRATYYVCGPKPFMRDIVRGLPGTGVRTTASATSSSAQRTSCWTRRSGKWRLKIVHGRADRGRDDELKAAAQPSEDDIRRLVTTFYVRVRRDALLSPVFLGALGKSDTAWTRHLARLCDFWSSVMLTSGRYHGDPFSVPTSGFLDQPADVGPLVGLVFSKPAAICSPGGGEEGLRLKGKIPSHAACAWACSSGCPRRDAVRPSRRNDPKHNPERSTNMTDTLYPPMTRGLAQKRRDLAPEAQAASTLSASGVRRWSAFRQDEADRCRRRRARDTVPLLHQGPHQGGAAGRGNTGGTDGGDLGRDRDAGRWRLRALHAGLSVPEEEEARQKGPQGG